MMDEQTNDLTGQKFGKLTVLKPSFRYKQYGWYWLCQCNCGKKVVEKGCKLVGGSIQSCGCLRKHRQKRNYVIHGNTVHGGRSQDGKESRLYRIWSNMKARCNRKSHPAYMRYGGRGIRICAEWMNDYTAFRDWAFRNGYTDEMTIDRMDIDGDYEPGNCQWLTKSEHARKTNIEKNKKK